MRHDGHPLFRIKTSFWFKLSIKTDNAMGDAFIKGLHFDWKKDYHNNKKIKK